MRVSRFGGPLQGSRRPGSSPGRLFLLHFGEQGAAAYTGRMKARIVITVAFAVVWVSVCDARRARGQAGVRDAAIGGPLKAVRRPATIAQQMPDDLIGFLRL